HRRQRHGPVPRSRRLRRDDPCDAGAVAVARGRQRPAQAAVPRLRGPDGAVAGKWLMIGDPRDCHGTEPLSHGYCHGTEPSSHGIVILRHRHGTALSSRAQRGICFRRSSRSLAALGMTDFRAPAPSPPPQSPSPHPPTPTHQPPEKRPPERQTPPPAPPPPGTGPQPPAPSPNPPAPIPNPRASIPMKIASWNVNSLNVRLPHLEQWLRDARPDVVGIQETKLADEKFPDAVLAGLGYRSVFSGQKTYNGVAILARDRALDDVQMGIPGFEDDQKRVIAATVDGVRVVNLYVVNGQDVGTEKY